MKDASSSSFPSSSVFYKSCSSDEPRCECIYILLNIYAMLVLTASDGPVVSCCQKTSNTMLERAKIKSYYKQKKGLCPVDAVIFVTVKGKKLCSDPTSAWVKKTMAYVNEKKRARSKATTRAMGLSTETSAVSWNTTSTPRQT